jgi:hypothetical protein
LADAVAGADLFGADAGMGLSNTNLEDTTGFQPSGALPFDEITNENDR